LQLLVVRKRHRKSVGVGRFGAALHTPNYIAKCL
jgi:hypothetical protein